MPMPGQFPSAGWQPGSVYGGGVPPSQQTPFPMGPGAPGIMRPVPGYQGSGMPNRPPTAMPPQYHR